MKSLLKFIIITAGIISILSYFLNFKSSGNIPQDVGNITQHATQNALDTFDSLKLKLSSSKTLQNFQKDSLSNKLDSLNLFY